MNVVDVLATPGMLGAWDSDDVNDETLVVYRVGDDGAHEQARSSITASERPGLLAQLAARGITLGRCNAWCSYVWVRDTRGLSLWDNQARVLDATRTGIEVRGTRFAVEQIARVESFAHAEVVADHGVRLIDRCGARIAIAAKVPDRERPAWDPFVSGWAEDELMGAFQWARWLAEDLATTLGVPYEHVEPAS